MGIPQGLASVQLLAPTTTNGGATSRAISTKNALEIFIVVDLKQAVGHATAISLRQATTIALGATAAGPTVPNWLNEDCALNDTIVRGTDGAAVTVTNNIKSKQIVFQILPAKLTTGYPCVYITAADSSQATNLMNVSAYVRPRYAGDAPPSFVLD